MSKKQELDLVNIFSTQEELLEYVGSKEIALLDQSHLQLGELCAIHFSKSDPTEEEILNFSANHRIDFNWVYFPWKKIAVKVLNCNDYQRIRQNRNLYKLTPDELKCLSNKRVGVVGLSVGSSIAYNLVQEGVGGALRLADFDSLGLSNFNRIRASVTDLGKNKAHLAYRTIKEIDPYYDVEIFPEGVNEGNIEQFILGNGKLDVLIDECDSLEIKIALRKVARKHKIPVIMDTSDNEIIDLERFDLEPNRPIFHGLINEEVSTLTESQKLSLILNILPPEILSVRAKASLLEISESLCTWPQLASSINIGAGKTTRVVKSVLLGESIESQRWINDEGLKKSIPVPQKELIPDYPSPITVKESFQILKRFVEEDMSMPISTKLLDQFFERINSAPSAGNDQPWKILVKNNLVGIFHDPIRSESFGDYNLVCSMLTMGGVFNTAIRSAQELGIDFTCLHGDYDSSSGLVAIFMINGQTPVLHEELNDVVLKRYTDRRKGLSERSQQDVIDGVNSILKQTNLDYRTYHDIDEKNRIGEIVGLSERIRIMSRNGHESFVNREINWKHARNDSGINPEELSLPEGSEVIFKMIADYEVIAHLKKVNGGKGLRKFSKELIQSADVVVAFFTDDNSRSSVFNVGQKIQDFWYECTLKGYCFQSFLAPVFMLERIKNENDTLEDWDLEQLRQLQKETEKTFGGDTNQKLIYICRVFGRTPLERISKRRPLKDVVFYD